MKYTPPKTRIKITKNRDGFTSYQPQYQVLWFSWNNMKHMCAGHLIGNMYFTLTEAQERIDKFLVDREEQYKQDVGGKTDSVEYVKYP